MSVCVEKLFDTDFDVQKLDICYVETGIEIQSYFSQRDTMMSEEWNVRMQLKVPFYNE